MTPFSWEFVLEKCCGNVVKHLDVVSINCLHYLCKSIEVFYACQQFIRFFYTGEKDIAVVSCQSFYIIVRKASEGAVGCGCLLMHGCSFLFCKKQEAEFALYLDPSMFNKVLSM